MVNTGLIFTISKMLKTILQNFITMDYPLYIEYSIII